jgi:hypothetical protein
VGRKRHTCVDYPLAHNNTQMLAAADGDALRAIFNNIGSRLINRRTR